MSRDLRYLPKLPKQNLYPPLNRLISPLTTWHYERMAEHLNHHSSMVADLSIRKEVPKPKEKQQHHSAPHYSSYNHSIEETIDLSVKKRKHPAEELDLSSKSNVPLDLNFSKKAKVQENHHHHHQQHHHHHHSGGSSSSKLLHNAHHKKHSLPPPPQLTQPLDLNGHLNGGMEIVAIPPPPKKTTVPLRELTEEEKAKRDKQIRKLKLELFNEEMKLMLLKKLQQSQLAKEPVLPEKPQSHRGTPPPPLIRNVCSKPPPPAVPPSKQSAPPSRPGPPPPLVLGNSSARRSAAHFQGPYNYHALGESMRQASGTPPDTQTPAQRQAAAKLALRKQLEKTLLQIPPPKPPPPEMHFLPNGNNQEFVYLLGLEWIVNLVVDETYGTQSPPAPFECSQCGTDFTPVWKWKDTGGGHKSPAVVCESCVTSNIKKALKAEHTNRLKTAFVKALQQEQEIEQRMTTPPPALSPPTSVPRFPKLTPAQQSFLQAQALQLLPQPAHMLPTGPFPPPPLLAAAAAAYSYQMLASGGKQASDLQRQYLLDMIPPPTSSSQSTSSGWKT